MHGVEDHISRRMEWETVPGTLSLTALSILASPLQTPNAPSSSGSMDDIGWEMVPGTLSLTAPRILASPLQTPKASSSSGSMDGMLSPLQASSQQHGLFPYLGTAYGAEQLIEVSTHQLHQTPTFGPFLGYSPDQDLTNCWGYGQLSASPVDQCAVAPWTGQSDNLTPVLHEPPNPEGPAKRAMVTTQSQAQLTTNKSRKDSNHNSPSRKKGYSSLDRQAYRAYHREVGRRTRKKDREERARMEAATKDLEQVHASLVARERALMEERLALREELYLHARMCNDERIVSYLASTAQPM